MSKAHGLKPLTQREKDGLLKFIENVLKDCEKSNKGVLESICDNMDTIYLMDSLVGSVTIYKDLYDYDDQKLVRFHESLVDGDLDRDATAVEVTKLLNFVSDRLLLFSYKFHYTFGVGEKEIRACLKVEATIFNGCLTYEITPIVEADNDIIEKMFRLPKIYTNYINDTTYGDFYYLDEFINNDTSFISNIRENFIIGLAYPICDNINELVQDKDISTKDISIKLTSLDYTFKEVIKSSEVFETIKEIHTDDPESLLSYDEEASAKEEVSEVLDLNSDFECPCNSHSVIKMDSTSIKDERTKSIVEFVEDVIPDETFLAMAVIGQDYFEDDSEGVVKTTSDTVKKIISDNIKLFDDSTEFRIHRVIRITDNSSIHDFASIAYNKGKYVITPYVHNTLTGEIDKKNEYEVDDISDFLHGINDLIRTWVEFGTRLHQMIWLLQYQ